MRRNDETLLRTQKGASQGMRFYATGGARPRSGACASWAGCPTSCAAMPGKTILACPLDTTRVRTAIAAWSEWIPVGATIVLAVPDNSHFPLGLGSGALRSPDWLCLQQHCLSESQEHAFRACVASGLLDGLALGADEQTAMTLANVACTSNTRQATVAAIGLNVIATYFSRNYHIGNLVPRITSR